MLRGNGGRSATYLVRDYLLVKYIVTLGAETFQPFNANGVLLLRTVLRKRRGRILPDAFAGGYKPFLLAGLAVRFREGTNLYHFDVASSCSRGLQ